MRKVLISCSSMHIGDFIWATSAIAVLKKTFPETHITVTASKTLKELIADNPVIDDVIFTLYPENSIKGKLKNLFCSLKNIPKILSGKYDDCVILSHSKVTVLIAKLCGIKNLIGADLMWTGYDIKDPLAKFYTHTVKVHPDQNNMHMSVRFQTIIKSYYNIYNNALPVLADPKNCDIATKIIKDKNAVNIALCVQGSKLSNHIWRLENFSSLVRSVNEKIGNANFYLMGSMANFEHSQKLVGLLSGIKIYNICGKTSLLDMVCLFNELKLLFSVDTGTIHIAATTNIPILSIHGATLPAQTGPMSGKSVTFYEGAQCSPCMKRTLIENKSCPYLPFPICLDKIKPETAAKKIIKILGNDTDDNRS